MRYDGAISNDEIRFPSLGFAGFTLRTLDLAARRWSIYWIDSRYGRLFPSVQGGFDGDELPYIPEFSGSMTLDYYFPLGSWNGHAGGSWRWVGDRNTEVGEDPLALDGYDAIDLNADISNENWTFRLYVRNATDERAYQTVNSVASLVTGVEHHLGAVPIQPRTIGLEFDYRF